MIINQKDVSISILTNEESRNISEEINMHLTNDTGQGTAIIIGSSLSGLMTGISLAREGIHVTMIEKSKEGERTGAGLQVDGSAFEQSTTARLLRKLASGGKSSIQLWTNIEARLRKEAKADSLIELEYGLRVEEIGQSEETVWVKTEDGKVLHADILIGADGHYSMVRGHIAPHKPDAEFAGYIVWISSIDEEDLPIEQRPDRNLPQVSMLGSYDGFMFGSIMEQEEKNSRRIGCTWYDNTHNDVLRELGCVKDGIVHHSLIGEDIPEDTLQQLMSNASDRWPAPWSFAILHAIETRNIIGIPIKEYIPDYLVKDRIALIGDAAHVPAPITASGFNASLDDAVELGKCAAKGVTGKAGIKALKKYESGRLKKVRRIVESGNSFSQSFGRP